MDEKILLYGRWVKGKEEGGWEGEREGKRTSWSMGAWLEPPHSGTHASKVKTQDQGSPPHQRVLPALPYLQSPGLDPHQGSV